MTTRARDENGVRAEHVNLAGVGLTVSLVIPAFNEAANLPWVLGRLPEGLLEVLIIDGGSADDTVAVARALVPGIRVLGQHAPGKGAALAAGLLAAQGDVAVMIDADGSMDPREIMLLVAAIAAGADVAKGSRYLAGGGSADISRLRSAGNRGLNVLARTTHRQRWSELCYGLAAFRTSCLHVLELEKIAGGGSMRGEDLDLMAEGLDTAVGDPASDSLPAKFGSRRPREYGHGFEIETLLFLRAVLAGLVVAEVPSFERPRQHGESNLHTWRDGWRVLGAVRHENRRVRRGRRGAARRGTPAPLGAALRADLATYPVEPVLQVDTRPRARP